MGKTTISDAKIFTSLFKEVYVNCFGQDLGIVPTESECRHLSNDIEEKTGLVIGWKSLKNYAQFVLEKSDNKQANPSPATLDTLSRYLMGALAISEIERKNSNAPYSFWFQYRERFLEKEIKLNPGSVNAKRLMVLFAAIFVLIVSASIISHFSRHFEIEENFEDLDSKTLAEKGWYLLSENKEYWERRNESPGNLILFTLKGDSWRSKEQPPLIQNLLYRKVPNDNFSTEIHFSSFIPSGSWQQAGLIFMEDTLFKGRHFRVSIEYNDYFGGLTKPAEILVYVVASKGADDTTVEEKLAQPLFKLDSTINQDFLDNNLKYSAIKVEKRGNKFRFLVANFAYENFSFRELKICDMDIEPKYVGIFAFKGFYADSTSVIPVPVSYFKLEKLADD